MSNEFETHPELVKKRARSILLTRILISIVLLYAFVILTLVGVNAIVSFASRHALLDCTTPAGKCYQEGQKRTGEFLAGLNKASDNRAAITREVVKEAAYCNNLLPPTVTPKQFEDCINARMDK